VCQKSNVTYLIEASNYLMSKFVNNPTKSKQNSSLVVDMQNDLGNRGSQSNEVEESCTVLVPSNVGEDWLEEQDVRDLTYPEKGDRVHYLINQDEFCGSGTEGRNYSEEGQIHFTLLPLHHVQERRGETSEAYSVPDFPPYPGTHILTHQPSHEVLPTAQARIKMEPTYTPENNSNINKQIWTQTKSEPQTQLQTQNELLLYTEHEQSDNLNSNIVASSELELPQFFKSEQTQYWPHRSSLRKSKIESQREPCVQSWIQSQYENQQTYPLSHLFLDYPGPVGYPECTLTPTLSSACAHYKPVYNCSKVQCNEQVVPPIQELSENPRNSMLDEVYNSFVGNKIKPS